MKSVKEIRDAGAMFVTDPGEAFAKLTEALIGITEHLEAQEKPRGVWGRQVDPEVQEVMDRLVAAEARQKKIDEYLKSQSVRSDDTIRREGRIEGLQAAATAAALTSDMHMLRQRLAITITRLENGGDL